MLSMGVLAMTVLASTRAEAGVLEERRKAEAFRQPRRRNQAR